MSALCGNTVIGIGETRISATLAAPTYMERILLCTDTARFFVKSEGLVKCCTHTY